MRQLFLFFLFLAIFVQCTKPVKQDDSIQKTGVSQKSDSFYEDTGGLDYDRLPIRRPYYLIRLNGTDQWIFQQDDSLTSIIHVLEFNVDHDYFFGKHGAYEIMGNLHKAAWFIFNLQTEEVDFFYGKDQWKNALQKKKIKRDVQLHLVEPAWEQMRQSDHCDWCP